MDDDKGKVWIWIIIILGLALLFLPFVVQIVRLFASYRDFDIPGDIVLFLGV